MAIGIIRQIASGTHQQVTIPSGNYPWPTIRVLNPNDGVVYVKQNADITSIGYGSWDYKVPSQSFGLLPGEGQGWQSVGLYYLDQSGSGANGEISIYLTQQDATEPVFVSIGRAIVSQTTSMDIVQGSQPANPGAGISRIWSSPSGSLNVLLPSGQNNVIYDNTNIGTVSLGGDLYGTISAAHIGIRYGDNLAMYDTNTVLQVLLLGDSANNTLMRPLSANPRYWQNFGATANIMVLDNSGNLNINGNLVGVNLYAIANIQVQGGEVFLNGANTAGIQWDGTYIQLFGPASTSGVVNHGNFYYFANNAGININYNGTFLETPQAFLSSQYIIATTSLSANGGWLYLRSDNGVYLNWNTSIANQLYCNVAFNAASIATGPPLSSGWPIGGDINVSRGNNTGYVFLGNTNTYIGFNGQRIALYGAQVIINTNQTCYFDSNAYCGATGDGTNLLITSYQGAIYARSLALEVQNFAGNGWSPVNASAFNVTSAARFKHNIQELQSPLDIVTNPELHGISFQEIETDKDRIGFVADPWAKYLPQVVLFDGEEVRALNYGEIGAVTFEALKHYIAKTDARLALLEAK